MCENINIIIVLIIGLWLVIGFIYGFKIFFPFFLEHNRITDTENYDYITVMDICFLAPLLMLSAATGIVMLISYYLIKFQDKKIIIKTSKRNRDN